MRTTVKCESCRHIDVLDSLPNRHTCPHCGLVTILVQEVPKPPPQPRKQPFSPGWKFMADVVSHPERGIVLLSERPPVFKQFVLADDAVWTRADLAGFRASFEVVRTRSDGALVVKVISAPPKEKKSLGVIRIPAHRLARKNDVELAFPPIGESELEKLAASGAGVIDRIDQLASHKDDPIAWWTLALGHRSARLRRPIEGALLGVGIEKIDLMLRQSHMYDWDIELLEFVGVEMAKPRPRGGMGATLPGDKSGFDKPWWADD